MTTRGDELTNPNQQFPHLLRMKFWYRALRHLIQLPVMRSVDVPLLEETVEMSGENSQGLITEEAFFTVSPGARQVRQRKEVKMNQLSPAERHEFLKSMEVEWQTLLHDQAAKVLSLDETAQAQAHWPDRAMDTSAGPVPGSQTTASHRGDVPRQDSLSRVLQTRTSLTSSHILRHLPGRAS